MAEIAIQNIEKSLSVDEIEALLKLSRNQYHKIKSTLESIDAFSKRSSEYSEDDGSSNAKILTNSINNLVKKQTLEMMSDDLSTINYLVEFVNKFSEVENYLEEIDLTTI